MHSKHKSAFRSAEKRSNRYIIFCFIKRKRKKESQIFDFFGNALNNSQRNIRKQNTLSQCSNPFRSYEGMDLNTTNSDSAFFFFYIKRLEILSSQLSLNAEQFSILLDVLSGMLLSFVVDSCTSN